MSKKSAIVTICSFCLFIAVFFVINLITPAKEFSELENRYLEQMPELSKDSIFSGEFAMSYEKYISDQFVGRDGWVSMKSRLQQLSGKRENNGVYLADGGVLINRFDTPDFSQLDRNIAGIQGLSDKLDIPVITALVPTAAAVWSERLPKGAPSYNQDKLVSYINEKMENDIFWLYDALEAHDNEYIYYQTDHHWTSLGAYYGYEALGEVLGYDPKSFPEEYVKQVEDFYGTTFSSSGVRNITPDVVNIVVPEDGITVEVDKGNGYEPFSLYDFSFAEEKDKYSIFFGGNQPVLKISGKGEGALLVVKDSFANCLLPFLAQDYKTIYVADMRFLKISMADFAIKNDVDKVLVLYSMQGICDDVNMGILGI